MLDIAEVRADTAGCDGVAHFNSAGSSLPPRQVVDAVVDYLRQEELLGGYEAQAAMADRLEVVYRASARLLNCEPQHIAFANNASDAWWRAFSSVPLASGDRVLIGRSEFQANAFGLLQARDRGVQIDVVPNDDMGEIDLNALDSMIDGNVALIALTQISMSNGAVQPAAEVGKRARRAGIPFLLDACQAAGQLPLDVEELGCDFLVYTGRKFMRGPRGTGILYVRPSILDHLGPTPFVDARSAVWTGPETYHFQTGSTRFEVGELNYAGKAGLGVATEYALNIGIDAIADRVQLLANRLRSELAQIEGVQVRDEGRRHSGIVTFTVESVEPSEVQAALSKASVNVSAPGRNNAQLDLGTRGIESVVRAGVHYFNTDDEIDRLLAVVSGLG